MQFADGVGPRRRRSATSTRDGRDRTWSCRCPRTARAALSRAPATAASARVPERRPTASSRWSRDVVAYAVADVDPDPGAELGAVLADPRGRGAVARAARAEPALRADRRTSTCCGSPPTPRLRLRPGRQRRRRPRPRRARRPRAGRASTATARSSSGAATTARCSFVESRFLRAAAAADRSRARRAAVPRPAQNMRGASIRRPAASAASCSQVWDTLAAPQLADWNADGSLDVVALAGSRLAVWLQARRTGASPSARRATRRPRARHPAVRSVRSACSSSTSTATAAPRSCSSSGRTEGRRDHERRRAVPPGRRRRLFEQPPTSCCCRASSRCPRSTTSTATASRSSRSARCGPT